MYRAPFSDKWEEKSWDWAVTEIAKRAKATWDASFYRKERQRTGGKTAWRPLHTWAAPTSTWKKSGAERDGEGLGHRIFGPSGPGLTQPNSCGLAESFGRGAMTNHYVDLKNSDCFLIMAAIAAENHPISMRWVMKAKENGATVISVDPRFTRTSAVADVYAR